MFRKLGRVFERSHLDLGFADARRNAICEEFSHNIEPDAAKCAKMAPHREKMIFLQNPWIFGNFRKLRANSEKIEKIASRDSLEQKTAPHVRCDERVSVGICPN